MMRSEIFNFLEVYHEQPSISDMGNARHLIRR